MTVKNNLIGQKFWALTVIAEYGRNKNMNVLWECRCECGKTAVALAYDLKTGKVKSCKCGAGVNRGKHLKARQGNKRSKIYAVWSAMVQRCTNPNEASYHRYGERGITVCEEWRKFENFYACVGDPPFSGATLERINNDLGYCPDNVRWGTWKEQGKNKSNSVYIEARGETLIQAEWCRKIGCRTNAIIYYTKAHDMTKGEAVEWLLQKKGL